MCLLRAVDLPNINLCCLLVTQCSQNGKFTNLSPEMGLRSTRIFKPHSDMWPSLQCHVIVISSWLAEATDAFASCRVSPTSMYRFITIFYALITTITPLITFKIPPSMWVLKPSSSSWPIDNKFFLKPFTCLTP